MGIRPPSLHVVWTLREGCSVLWQQPPLQLRHGLTAEQGPHSASTSFCPPPHTQRPRLTVLLLSHVRNPHISVSQQTNASQVQPGVLMLQRGRRRGPPVTPGRSRRAQALSQAVDPPGRVTPTGVSQDSSDSLCFPGEKTEAHGSGLVPRSRRSQGSGGAV